MVETGPIQLRTNARRDLAVRLAVEMHRTYDVMARFAMPCAPKGDKDRIQVTVLRAREFDLYAGGAGGFYRRATVTWLPEYDGQIVLPDNLASDSRQVFQHEVTHRLAEACFVRIPSWLNEGLAGFFEMMDTEADRVTFGRTQYAFTSDPRVRHPRRLRVNGQRIWVLPMNALPSIKSMFSLAGPWRTHDWAENTSRYAIAWALVHFFVLGAPDLTPRFETYLAGLRAAGGNPQALFAKSFEDVPLQTRLDAYLRRGRFDMLQSRPVTVEAGKHPQSPRVREMQEEEGHLHLAWLGARARDKHGRERFRLHVAAAKQHPRTRDAAYLVAAASRLAHNDPVGADREVQDGLRGAANQAPFLEAHLDTLLARKTPVVELLRAAERLRPVATTAGQLCSLASLARRLGDHRAAVELSKRGLELNPRLVFCRIEVPAERATQAVPAAPDS